MIQGWAIGLVVLFSAVFLFFGLQHLHQHWIDSESEMQTFYPSSGQGIYILYMFRIDQFVFI